MTETVIVQTQKQREAELRTYYQQGYNQARDDMKEFFKQELELLKIVKNRKL